MPAERAGFALPFAWENVRVPGDEVVTALRAVPQLPPLTKATTVEWAEKAFVPVIMATDARDYANCTEPALQRIAKQRSVKSRATFKSRLLGRFRPPCAA